MIFNYILLLLSTFGLWVLLSAFIKNPSQRNIIFAIVMILWLQIPNLLWPLVDQGKLSIATPYILQVLPALVGIFYPFKLLRDRLQKREQALLQEIKEEAGEE